MDKDKDKDITPDPKDTDKDKEGGKSGGDDTKTLTQKEIDEMISARLKRERESAEELTPVRNMVHDAILR